MNTANGWLLVPVVKSAWRKLKSAIGDVVPMPTLPVSPAMVRNEAPVDEAMWKIGLVWPAVPWIESLPHGEVVPMPSEPAM